ncbi:MAG: hypothetical protein JWL70_294 [Acidimicrobiia bacterium]|nr:hypothetical protein [Acidimicrobiia bacterium]
MRRNSILNFVVAEVLAIRAARPPTRTAGRSPKTAASSPIPASGFG